jgi:hypothetical protein
VAVARTSVALVRMDFGGLEWKLTWATVGFRRSIERGYYRVVNVYTGAMKCTKRTRISPRGRPTVASWSTRDKSHLPSHASRETEVIMAVIG